MIGILQRTVSIAKLWPFSAIHTYERLLRSGVYYILWPLNHPYLTQDGVRVCEVVSSMETSSEQAKFDTQLNAYQVFELMLIYYEFTHFYFLFFSGANHAATRSSRSRKSWVSSVTDVLSRATQRLFPYLFSELSSNGGLFTIFLCIYFNLLIFYRSPRRVKLSRC